MPNPVNWLAHSIFLRKRSKSAKFPQELVDEIISNVYDRDTLLSCSKTCYSLYIAARPHLYRSLSLNWTDKEWPKQVQELYELDLFPLFKRSRIDHNWGFTPLDSPSKQFYRDNLRHFSALKNLQDLWIDNLEPSSFMSDMGKYFAHLAPTLQSLALKNPKGSLRQTLYFIGFFPILQDLNLSTSNSNEAETTASLALVPPSRPPLRGWLTLEHSTGEKFVEDMISVHGGLRFRYVELVWMGESDAQQLLDACVETLETLQLGPGAYDLFVRSPLDLSRHESIKTVKLSAGSITNPAFRGFLENVLSAITSPLPLDLVIVYDYLYFQPELCRRPSYIKWPINTERENHQLKRFEELSQAHEARNFQLVLCAEVPRHAVEYATGILKRDVHKMGKDKKLRALRLSESSIIFAVPRMSYR